MASQILLSSKNISLRLCCSADARLSISSYGYSVGLFRLKSSLPHGMTVTVKFSG